MNYRLLFIFLLINIGFINLSHAQEKFTVGIGEEDSQAFRPNFKLVYTPFVGVKTPKGESTFSERQISSDIKNGYSYGVYLGMDIVDKFDSESFGLGVGLLFQEGQHDSDSDIYQLTTESFVGEINFYNTIYRSKKLDIIQQFSLGMGVIYFDYDENRENFSLGVGQLRYMLNLEFNKHFDLDFGGGLFVWSDIGDTQAYGGCIMIQLGYRF